MKKAVILLMCALMLSGTVSCAKKDKDAGESGSDMSGAAYAEKIDYRSDKFEDDLIAYLCLNGYYSENFIVSPEAFRASLCIAAEGARGNTRTELLKAAGFSGMDNVNTWYSELNTLIVNSVWSSENDLGSFSDSYASTIAEKYNADVFSRKSDEMAQAIKEKTVEKTDGMTFDEADRLDGVSSVMIGALNLQAAWGDAFSGAAVGDGVFTDSDGNEYSMSFAEKTGEFLYTEATDGQVLVIPMENDLSFVCCVGGKMNKLGKTISLKREKVHVVLPKFELESVFDSRDLFGFLLERGVDDAINSQRANFYNMCSDGDWFMQEIVQKSKISFDGAYSSKKRKSKDTEESDDIKEFIADGPFTFMVFSDFGTEKQHMMLYGQMVDGN